MSLENTQLDLIKSVESYYNEVNSIRFNGSNVELIGSNVELDKLNELNEVNESNYTTKPIESNELTETEVNQIESTKTKNNETESNNKHNSNSMFKSISFKDPNYTYPNLSKEDIQELYHRLFKNDYLITPVKTYMELVPVMKYYYENTEVSKLVSSIKYWLVNFDLTKFYLPFESICYNYMFKTDTYKQKPLTNWVWSDSTSFNLFLYALFKTYPAYLYYIMVDRTIEEQLDIVKQLDKYDVEYKINIAQYDYHMQKYKNYLNNYYNTLHQGNILHNFNHLTGILFDKINVSYDELPLKCFIMHAGFNYTKDNILYARFKIHNDDFLNYNHAQDYKPLTESIVKLHDKPWEILIKNNTTSEDQIQYTETQFTPVICYDNDDDLTKCRFSYSLNQLVNPNVITNGGVYSIYDDKTLEVYFCKMFVRRKLNSIVRPNIKPQLMSYKELEDLTLKIVDSFDVNPRTCIKKLLSNFPKQYGLEIYAQGLLVKGVELDFIQYFEYIKPYFIPVLE